VQRVDLQLAAVREADEAGATDATGRSSIETSPRSSVGSPSASTTRSLVHERSSATR